MSFQWYESCRESGVEWLGAIPQHWETLRLKRLFEIVKRIANSDGHDVLAVTQRGVQVKDLEANQGQFSEDYSKYQLVHPGDFVMNHMDLLTGYADVSGYHGVTSPDYRVFRLRSPAEHDPRFLIRVIQNAYRRKIFYAFGQGASHFGRWRLPTDAFNDFVIAVPPLAEQCVIADFLDRETAKIDALVDEQSRLIELLKEKRQAIISHAVTKGLDPNAPMKDSGVEWLGQVPEHWEVTKLSRHLNILPGYAFPSAGFSNDPADTRLLRGVNVGLQEIRWLETVYWKRTLDDDLDEFVLRAGEVVIGMDRPWINGGIRVATIREEDLPCLLLQRVAVLRPRKGLQEKFVYLLLQCQGFAAYLTPDLTGVSVPHISGEQIGSFPVALPPPDEQVRIVALVESELNEVDRVVAEAEASIALLQERRTALISAAVTGKIDVRGAAPAAAEAA